MTAAATAQTVTKVKPKHPTPPPAAQKVGYPKAAAGDIVPQLTGIDNKKVSLKWNNPETMNGLFDDFEGHNDFVINSPGALGWQYIDADNEPTYTWTAADFPNQGQPMAFIVFNPSKTSPSTATWPDIKPFSGNKMLVDFTVDGGNNDYLISPALSFDEDFQFSFRARSYTESYGRERFRVGYSMTGTRPSDFKWIQQGDYEEVPAAWTLCKYAIPKEARYVCINCVSQEAFMFMVDDIFIGTNIVRPKAPAATRLAGFNILRNGVKVNSTTVTEMTYTDEVPDYGRYTYTIEPVMTDGSKGTVSKAVEVNVPDIRLLPFEDTFSGNDIDSTLWSRPVDEKGNENKWKRDYYAYGLVDFSACYPYSNIGSNYSQSLVSRELRTPDAANTWLRFQVRLDNNPKYTGSYMSAEVSADDGKTWTSLVDIPNDEGTFSWRTYEYPLAGVLKGAEFFKIRFRAHGKDSWTINYWYVDDVKVWCPQVRPATVSVTASGTPVAGAAVTLTADNGAIYKGTTDAAGKMTVDRMELGQYDVDIEARGCEIYTGKWNLTADAASTLDVALLHPVVNWDAAALNITLPQETTAARTAVLTNSGNGTVYWNLAPQPEPQSGDATGMFTPGESFDASGDLQSSIGFDGQYFYTASTYTLGRYYKYDRNGKFIEEFLIPGMYYKLYDLAYDGTYFYGSDYSNHIFQLDMRNKRLVKEIVVESQPSLTITHIAYDTRNDQFWVGDWTRLGRVDRNGKVTVDFFNIGGTGDDMAVMGTAFDNVSKGGPYLWLSNLAYAGKNTIDKLQILQYDLNNRRLTGVKHVADDIPGYKVGTIEVPVNIGGIELTTQLHPGELTMTGLLIQSPSRIFTYKMGTFDSWYKAEPMSGELKPGETATVTVQADTRDFGLNETRKATIAYRSRPATDAGDLVISLTADKATATPRPSKPAVSIDEAASTVNLTWQPAAGAQPAAYDVLRDSVKIATTEKTAYTDTSLLRGSYAYSVKALYGDSRTASEASDTALAVVKTGAPFFRPAALKASIAKNSYVTLTWQQPDALLKSKATLRWDEDRNDDAIGMTEGGYFYAGVAFDADDLEPYRGMTLSSVDVFIKVRVQALSLKIYKDGKSIRTQRIKDDIKYGEFNTFQLNEPVTIERGSSYIISFLVMHDAGLRPLGTHNGNVVEGKSNLMSENGREWYPASYAGFSNTSFNIAANLTPSEGYTEKAPAAYRILRNGKETGRTSATTFSETLPAPGSYTYQVVSEYDDNRLSTPSNTATVVREDIGKPHAPYSLNATVERNRKVELRWNFPITEKPSVPVDLTAAAGTSPAGLPELVNQFRGTFTGEYGVASDGRKIYASRHAVPGVIDRYSLDGTFEESIGIKTSLQNGFADLDYDGSAFWAAGKSNTIYQLDMQKGEITDERSISEIARHLAFVPDLDGGQGGFETGDWETSINVTRRGAKLSDGPALKGAAGSAYCNGVLYTFEQGYETSYELCARNFLTGELLWHKPVSAWSAVTPSSGASAGGLSVMHTSEGLTLLCALLQESAGARFMFFDLGSVKGLAGYNVYRNGVKINATPLPQRYFSETLSEPGDYKYQIQTEYIDGSVSELSAAQTLTIVPATPGETPHDIKAKASTDGYDIHVSVFDPTIASADQFVSFEAGQPLSATGFKTTTAAAFAGNSSMVAPVETECEWILPVEKTYTSGFNFGFAAANGNDNEGSGTVQVLASDATSDAADFVKVGSVSTAEAWKRFTFTLPAGTRYVALRCPARYAEQYIDAVSVSAGEPGQIYAFDIMRGDSLLNGAKPVEDVSFTDHNLLPGTYTYKVRAYYDNASISEWSEPVSITIDYSNGHQAPGQLSVEQREDGNMLSWSTPALSGVKELRWHNGISAAAAGLPSGGSFYAGTQFNPETLKDYATMSVSQISFYVNQVPDVAFVQLWQGQDLVFEKYVETMKQYAMNTVTLDKPVAVDPTRPMRAVVYVEHNQITVPLGYDAGPAKTGLGDLYSSDGVTWSTLTDNNIDGNWNITIGLQAYAAVRSATTAGNAPAAERFVRHAATPVKATTGPLKAAAYPAARPASAFFTGYNVYCNGEKVNDAILTTDAVSYLDTATHKGRYLEYQVKAVYPDFGEVGSNIVRIMTSAINNVINGNNHDASGSWTPSGTKAPESYRGIVIKEGRKTVRK